MIIMYNIFKICSNGNNYCICMGDQEITNYFDSYDQQDLKKIVEILNNQNQQKQKLKELVKEIFQTLEYMRDNELSYGDEYCSVILNDILEKYEEKYKAID